MMTPLLTLQTACSTSHTSSDVKKEHYCVASSNTLKYPVYTSDLVADKNNTIYFTDDKNKVCYRIEYPNYVVAKLSEDGEYYPIPVCTLPEIK